jgi:hypothetical protein
MWSARAPTTGLQNAKCRNILVDGTRGRGSRKTWNDCILDNMKRIGLKKEEA